MSKNRRNVSLITRCDPAHSIRPFGIETRDWYWSSIQFVLNSSESSDSSWILSTIVSLLSPILKTFTEMSLHPLRQKCHKPHNSASTSTPSSTQFKSTQAQRGLLRKRKLGEVYWGREGMLKWKKRGEYKWISSFKIFSGRGEWRASPVVKMQTLHPLKMQ